MLSRRGFLASLVVAPFVGPMAKLFAKKHDALAINRRAFEMACAGLPYRFACGCRGEDEGQFFHHYICDQHTGKPHTLVVQAAELANSGRDTQWTLER